MESFDILRNVHVAKPCRMRWQDMAGDERVRHCAKCRLNVFNFSNMTRDEVELLLHTHEGRICGRFYRRPDGMMLTRDCPNGAVPMRVSRIPVWTSALFLFSCLGAGLTRLGGNHDAGPNPLIENARSWPVVGRVIDSLFPPEPIMGVIAIPPTTGHPGTGGP